MQRSACLVPVQHSKVCQPQRQLAERPLPHVEHDAVAGAVHGLEAKLLLVDVETEHIFLVVVCVAGGLPQLEVVDVGRDNLVILKLPVLLAQVLHEGVVDACTVGEEKGGARGEMVEEEELLLQPYHAVVALLCLLDAVLVLLHELDVREGNAIHPHESLLLGVCAPERTRGRVYCHCLEVASVRHVRASAQIHHGTVAVEGQHRVLREAADDLHLKLVFEEHSQGLVSAYHHPLKLLLLLDDLLHLGLNGIAITFREGLVAHEAVIVEALFNGGSNSQIHAKL
mmetsp:Transcript_31380/g.43544  ORF Transcript_31380/g.43544 Transcript_31380/m.43544 type:complete len:284 (+) Transcript_31380:1044-1895(+)